MNYGSQIIIQQNLGTELELIKNYKRIQLIIQFHFEILFRLQHMPVEKENEKTKCRQLGFYVLIEIIIAYIGLCLLISNNHRSHFHAYFQRYISDEAKSMEYAELTLIILSIWMISILFVTHLYVKFACIFSFALYNVFSHNLFFSQNYKQDISELAINFVIVYLAIEGSFQIRDIEVQIKKRRQKIIKEQNYQDEGWYPMQLPIQDNDMESQSQQISRIKQLINRSEEQILGLEKQIKGNEGRESRKKLKKMRENQFDKYCKVEIKKIKQELLYKQLESSSRSTKRQSLKQHRKSKLKTN